MSTDAPGPLTDRATPPRRAAEAEAIHVLVVDDEPELRDLVRDYLTRHEIHVSTADGAAAMREVLKDRPVHVIVLDLSMPGEDGITIARQIRQQGGDVGIIMLTASVDKIDRIVGLEVGADDYMSKPFDPRELLARVRGLVRRLRVAERGAVPAGRLGREVRFGRCTLNIDAQTLYSVTGEEVPLTAMEFDLLKAFADRPNRVLSRDQLLTLAHHRDTEAFDRSIDVRIMRLRRKIEENPEKPRILKTVRGAGYLFDPSGKAAE